MRAPTFTDEQIVAAIAAAAAEVGVPLPVTAYDAWRRAGGHDAPSGTLIIRRMRSWNAACERAGIATNKTRSTSSRWSDEEIVAIVARYLAEPGAGSYAGYVAWARETEGVPSGAALRQRFPSWSELKDRARGE